ncbi:SLAP domain-containing protein [bacterium LRH843]|nr:SLAP domain-containing protein [bacterium LRH843]
MRIQVILIICFSLLLGGCGAVASSSTPVAKQEGEPSQPTIDEKLVHRFLQRGFEVDGMMVPTSVTAENAELETEESAEPTAAEKMAGNGNWIAVNLHLNDQANKFFQEQTIQYFKEDVYENYPPPKKNTMDAIATVIYKNESGFILDGLIRNGFTDQSFTLEQLKPLTLKLLTGNNHPWIVTTLANASGMSGVKSGEAVPFRLVIPKEQVQIPEFDHVQFSYHAVIEQPSIEVQTNSSTTEN